jgi:ribosomal protein S18 acetylase RimI-like enzyme
VPDPAEPRWAIEKLRAEHDRSGFACGHESLDEFLRKYASQNERTGVSQTYVAVRPGDRLICGYYSVAAGSVEVESLPEDQRKRLPRYPVPVAHLGRLAVDVRSRGQGLGELLLMDALERIVRVAESIGVHAVEVIAIDERARGFYAKYGFVALRDDPRHLYLSLVQIRKLGLA